MKKLFGQGADATATGIEPTDGQASQQPPPAAVPPGQQQAPPPGSPPGRAPEVPTPVAAVPPGSAPEQLSAAKAAALQEVNAALDAAQQAQQGGDFADYGQALQQLDDAMNKYREAK